MNFYHTVKACVFPSAFGFMVHVTLSPVPFLMGLRNKPFLDKPPHRLWSSLPVPFYMIKII